MKVFVNRKKNILEKILSKQRTHKRNEKSGFDLTEYVHVHRMPLALDLAELSLQIHSGWLDRPTAPGMCPRVHWRIGVFDICTCSKILCLLPGSNLLSASLITRASKFFFFKISFKCKFITRYINQNYVCYIV